MCLEVTYLDRRHPRVIENVNEVIQAVYKPDFPLLIHKRDSVAGAAMRDPGTRRDVPVIRPAEALYFHFVQDFPRIRVDDQETEKVVLVGVDERRIVVEHKYPNVVGKSYRANEFVRACIGDSHNLAVRRHESEAAVVT